jgi:hypothetical protein
LVKRLIKLPPCTGLSPVFRGSDRNLEAMYIVAEAYKMGMGKTFCSLKVFRMQLGDIKESLQATTAFSFLNS